MKWPYWKRFEFYMVLLMIQTTEGFNCSAGYRPVNSTHCCKSVTCPVDHMFRLCSNEGEEDECMPCPNGKINPNMIDTKNWSYEFDPCFIPDCTCPPEAIIEDLQKCQETSQKICTCNREKLFYGKDPNICQEMVNASIIQLVKKKGVELSLDGTVRPCPAGTFKPHDNSSICHPHHQCLEGYSVDVPGTDITDTVCKEDPSATSTVPTTTNLDDGNENSSGSGLSEAAIIAIAIFVGTMVTVGVNFACICIIRIQKKKQARSKKRRNNGNMNQGNLQSPLMNGACQNNDPSALETGSSTQGEAANGSSACLNRRNSDGKSRRDGHVVLKMMDGAALYDMDRGISVLDADQNTDRQIPVNNPLKHSSSETTEPNGLKIFEKYPPLELAGSGLNLESLLDEESGTSMPTVVSLKSDIQFAQECSLGEADCESKDQGIGHSHEASEFQTNVPKKTVNTAEAQSPRG
ncbi:uncharacterized protein LOC111128106 isoform X2 [Crassostrea virginica]